MPDPNLSSSTDPKIFTGALKQIANKPLLAPMTGALSKLLKLERLDRLCQESRQTASGISFIDETLHRLGVTVHLTDEDRSRIPVKGATVVVANHPYGFIEAAALTSLLASIRPDVRLMANSILGQMPDVRPWLILVDPFGGESANRANRRGLREAIAWLQQGGMLVIFPAGEVSHLHFRHPGIHDCEWNRTAAALIKRTGAAALPMFFDGNNSALFQLAGIVHPRLRTALLPREFFNKQGHVLQVRVGHTVPASQMESLDDAQATELLRHRTYWLAHRKTRASLKGRHVRHDDPLFEPIPPDWLRAELAALSEDHLLVESGAWQLFQTTRDECPFVVREIGRLREETFRQAGEGTGKGVDLDDYDDYYIHLVLWRKDLKEIAGAYRLCGTDRAKGRVYTKTLFRFHPQFFRKLSPAVELGRSFIRPSHQRSFQPLLLLWKGIGSYVARNPQYRYLFGPVSISNSYQKASRVLLADNLIRLAGAPELAAMVKPRRPFMHLPVNHLPQPSSIDELDSWLADLEPQGDGVPVLIRQYLKLGGRIATFHVDRGFGETLDGLLVVDLLKAEPKALERYMGKEGIRNFYEVQKAAAESK